MTQTPQAAAAAITHRALSLRIFRLRFRFLFVALLLVILASPFLDDSFLHRAYFVVLFAMVMLAAILIASDRHWHKLVALAIGAVWLVVSLIGLSWQTGAVTIFANLLVCLFSAFVLYLVMSNVVSAKEVDLNILLGAASVYLLIAIAWTASYIVIFELDPEAFKLIHGEARPYFHQFLYFSLTTLTTVGYGDITPVSPFAQIWATMEAVFGTLYMALLVARLVGLYQSQKAQAE